VKLTVQKGTSAAVHLAVRARSIRKGEYQLVHVRETIDQKVIGGLAFVIVTQEKETRQ